MEPSSSNKSRFNKRKRPIINDGSGTCAVHSKLTLRVSSSSAAPYALRKATKMYISPLSPSTAAQIIGPSTSNIIQPSTPSMAPSTPIPAIHDWTHSPVTPYERQSLLDWAISTLESLDPDEFTRLLTWASSKADMAAIPDPEEGQRFVKWSRSISRMPDPDEPRRKVLKWPHTSTMGAPDQHKRWSLQEEISKPFETALKRLQEEVKQNETAMRHGHLEDEDSYTDLKQEHLLYTCQKGMHGVYECQNALWIWPVLRNICVIDGGPREVGKKIKEKFPESDMIEGTPSINDLGFVTLELSGKWIAKSIHKMLKHGIHIWAPKLPVERVIVEHPSLDDEMNLDLFRRRAIGYTLMRILKYSKVDVTIGHPTISPTSSKRDMAQKVLKRWFPNEERQDQRDFDNAFKDLLAFWYGLQRADWMVYLTPVWKQEYIEFLTAAKLEEHVKSNRHKPTRTSYAGYRSCGTLEDMMFHKTFIGMSPEQDKLYRYKVKAKRPVTAKQAEDAKLLGYTLEAALDCVLLYIFLKHHRLDEFKVNIDDEIHKEEGNTFMYLLTTQAKIRRITDDYDDYRKNINELKASKFSKLILGKDEGWAKGEERILGFRLLEFTEVLEESCLSVLPHILCEYLYDLAKKFNHYYSCVCEAGSITDTSTLLLCEATAVVLEKGFRLLGIAPRYVSIPDQPSSKASVSVTRLPGDVPLILPIFHTRAARRSVDVNAREPPRNARFQLFSLFTSTATHLGPDKVGKVFGVISVSDKYGISLDGESHFFEPDFAHIPLFNHKWCDPITPTDSGLVYLGNSGHSVPLSSSIEVRMELYVAKDEECYQICNHKIELDLSDFWDEKSESACGDLTVSGEEGSTNLFYILLRDATDASLKVKFETKTPGREVCGYVIAYYGDDFLTECQCLPSDKYNYMSVLFLADHVLENGVIQLKKSLLAVPTKGTLVIRAYLEDAKSGEVIMKNSCNFKPQPFGCSSFCIVSGTDCEFGLTVDWKYPKEAPVSAPVYPTAETDSTNTAEASCVPIPDDVTTNTDNPTSNDQKTIDLGTEKKLKKQAFRISCATDVTADLKSLKEAASAVSASVNLTAVTDYYTKCLLSQE